MTFTIASPPGFSQAFPRLFPGFPQAFPKLFIGLGMRLGLLQRIHCECDSLLHRLLDFIVFRAENTPRYFNQHLQGCVERHQTLSLTHLQVRKWRGSGGTYTLVER